MPTWWILPKRVQLYSVILSALRRLVTLASVTGFAVTLKLKWHAKTASICAAVGFAGLNALRVTCPHIRTCPLSYSF